ncbi:hypothetical protein SAMN04487884_104105 [Butyrivibrio fibrisolvens]|uniref:Uncharacterized protein n=1 Tax=Butyrivibrio fibrisolvens TaxID=831 RepID=A0A1H9N9S0_BUTFI|nr:hypothetical protein [Butyrivibrio fibrisolvens]SER32662.1 hypothetical protein SAMN04487884_104105 [Butyrivibrio fibrisolvens]
MKRKNPSQASSPNVPIDLTSLLDVIFIFLFIVLASMTVGYSEQKQKLKEKEEIIDEKINEYLNETIDEEAIIQRLEDYDEQYLGTKVKFVSIVGQYSEEEPSIRIIRVDVPDDDPFVVEIYDDDGQNDAYDSIQKYLEEYVADNKGFAIVVSIGEVDILNRDYDAISRRLESISNEYTNVF